MQKVIALGILASTNGTDMDAIVAAIQQKKIAANIAVVISNKADAPVLERAKQHHLPVTFVDSHGKKREAFDQEVAKRLDAARVDLIVLIGYMRFLSPWFVEKYRNRIINVHPSLLPAFAGGMDLNVHAEVLKRGCKVTGCTIHLVDEGADTGPIIVQKTVAVTSTDTPDSLKKKVQQQEGDALIEAIALFQQDRITVEGTQVRILKK
ncbi:phosphoribosylglycinamide formyltransferase [Candidatus Woesearchaeota archaeon]|nr:phosphoribosylglycinamide formyltransferase [Candidatus Woesearchaeota archaeon]